MSNFDPLTEEYMREHIPSIYAEEHDGNRSNRYTLVRSDKMIEILGEKGWRPHRASQVTQRINATRLFVPRGHQKHMIVFRHEDSDLCFNDPRDATKKIYPEIIMFNSSDGKCKIKFAGGLFAFVCENGIIIPITTVGCFEMKHQDFDAKLIYDGASEFVEEVPKLLEVVDKWSHTDLTSSQQLEMASDAAILRWGKEFPIVPNQFLQRRRAVDAGNDLWTTFNVIQENAMQGGFKAERTKRKVKPITNIEQTKTINEGLWNLADEMYQELVA